MTQLSITYVFFGDDPGKRRFLGLYSQFVWERELVSEMRTGMLLKRCVVNAQSLKAMLFKIRDRPGMYLRLYSIFALCNFIAGYEYALKSVADVTLTSPNLPAFEKWLMKGLALKGNWERVIYLRKCNERDAFDYFFEQYEKFRKGGNHLGSSLNMREPFGSGNHLGSSLNIGHSESPALGGKNPSWGRTLRWVVSTFRNPSIR